MRIDIFEFIDYRYAASHYLSPFGPNHGSLACCLLDSMSGACHNANDRTINLVQPSDMHWVLIAKRSPMQVSGTYLVGTPAQYGCNADNTRCCKALNGAARYWCTFASSVMVLS